MGSESWISLAGILVSLALFGASAVFGIVGWFLSRMLADKDQKIGELKDDCESLNRANFRLQHRLTVIETVLTDRGYLLPKPISYPSPPPHNIEGTS